MKTFHCRVDGCDHADDAAHKIAAHTRAAHPEVYAQRKAERAARKSGGGASEDAEPDSATDPETELLYAANALFADSSEQLDAAAYGRIVDYLGRRYAPVDGGAVAA